jgi:hypothetical protein
MIRQAFPGFVALMSQVLDGAQMPSGREKGASTFPSASTNT